MIFHLIYGSETNEEIAGEQVTFSGYTEDLEMFRYMIEHGRPYRIFIEPESRDLQEPRGTMESISFWIRTEKMKEAEFKKECLKVIELINKLNRWNSVLPNRRHRRRR